MAIRGTQLSEIERPPTAAVSGPGRRLTGALRAAGCAAVLMILAWSWVFAGEEPSRVLVIDTERADRPLWTEFSAAFRSTLQDASECPVDVYFENLDLVRFAGHGYMERAETWLAEKYGGMRPEVVVLAASESYRLMSGWPWLLAEDTSVVFTAVDPETFRETGRLPRCTGLLSEFGYLETVRLALELLPDTRHLAIIGGPKATEAYSRFLYAHLVAAFAEELEIIDLTGLPLAEMRARAGALPEHSVLILTSIFTDGDGRPVTHPELVADIAPVANAPMFSFTKTELGYGTVGGYLFDSADAARETAALVARILHGEPAGSIAPRQADFNTLAFDWRELRRWGIPRRRLPPGSVVEFKPPTLWETHRKAVLLALLVFAAQGASIAALLRSRRQRKRLNRELHELSGELISAQEEERRRVARELHDDVSQRLALFAMELQSPGIEERLSTASAKVEELARDVHSIAHQLQPPRLQGGDLAQELEAFCAEVSSRHDLEVNCRLPKGEVDVPEDTALVLYRVAQEAMQNAVKHSGADEVSLELGVSSRWASVVVSDNGQGFDAERTGRHRALGIAGMRERLRLVGGWLNVVSVPGAGTTVSGWVPFDSQVERTG